MWSWFLYGILAVLLLYFVGMIVVVGQRVRVAAGPDALPLAHHSYPVHFDVEPMDTINLTNPYPCTELERKSCKLDNALSCIGCQNLIARCVHFEADVQYVDDSGVVVATIPKNATPNDGYCLAVTRVNESCNPWHGNLVLVKAQPDARESALFCICKNPGLVGNTQIRGACDTPFVCNGKVKDINVSLDEMKCVCENDLLSLTADGVPVCVLPLVKDFDFSTHVSSKMTLPIDHFNTQISTAYSGTILRDPCRYCAITGRELAAGAAVATPGGGYQCVGTRNILPIRLSATSRVLRGDQGPDGVIAATLSAIQVFGKFQEGEYYTILATLKKEDNTWMDAIFPGKDTITIRLTEQEVTYPGSFSDVDIDKGLVALINNRGFRYDGVLHRTNTDAWHIDGHVVRFDMSTITYAGGSVKVGAIAGPPFEVLWSREGWIEVAAMNPIVSVKTILDRPQFLINERLILGTEEIANSLKMVGINFEYQKSGEIVMQAIVAASEIDWNELRARVIPENAEVA